MKKLLSCGSLWLLPGLLMAFIFLPAFSALAQKAAGGTYTLSPVALSWSDAGEFGLLSGRQISADNSAFVSGAAGGADIITPTIKATNAVLQYGQGNVPMALRELQANIAVCSSLAGSTIDGYLAGQSLPAGVYALTGDARLTAENPLRLEGDSAAVYVFNISGRLSVETRAALDLGRVRPENVYWNIGIDLLLQDNALFSGTALAGGDINVEGAQNGKLSLLALGSIDLNHSPGTNRFYARQMLQSSGFIAYHMLSICADGTVQAWGNNNSHQLGLANSPATFTEKPGLVAGLTDVIAVAEGYQRSFAVRRVAPGQTEVYGWGDNGYNFAVQFSYLGLGPYGTAVNTGPTQQLPVLIPGLSGKEVIAVSAGRTHTLALTAAGEVYTWGDAKLLGNAAGTASDWPVKVNLPGPAKAITVGLRSSFVVLATGEAMAWGYNEIGELGLGLAGNRWQYEPAYLLTGTNGTRLTDVKTIRTGTSLTDGFNNKLTCVAAVQTTGGLLVWGQNQGGELGDGTFVNHNRPVPLPILNVMDMAWVSAEIRDPAVPLTNNVPLMPAAIALLADGSTLVWGGNEAGQFGECGLTNPNPNLRPNGALGSLIPMPGPAALTGLAELKGYLNAAKAVHLDGSITTWGSNTAGMLGHDNPNLFFPDNVVCTPAAPDNSCQAACQAIAGVDFSICQGSSVKLPPGQPAGGYWSGPGVGGGQTPGSTYTFNPAAIANPSANGAYTLTYHYSNPATGCTATATLTATVIYTPVNFSICGNVAALPAGGVWAGAGVTLVNGSYVFDAGTVRVPAGVNTYPVSFSAPGCNPANITITVNPLPIVAAGLNISLCDNQVQQLPAGSPAGGIWSGPGVQPSAIIHQGSPLSYDFNPAQLAPATAGNTDYPLTYTYTDPRTGCRNSANLTATVLSTAAAAAGPDFSVCQDAAARALTIGTPAGGSWSGPGVGLVNGAYVFDPAALRPGTYTLTYEYSGCSVTTGSLQATVLPVLAGPRLAVRNAVAGMCGAEVRGELQGGQPNAAYQLCLSGGPLTSPVCLNLTTDGAGLAAFSFPGLYAGSYRLDAGLTAQGQCSNSSQAFAVSGVQQLGEYGRLTTIDASQYGGAYAFNGEYYVAGPLELVGGEFLLEEDVVLRFEPEGGISVPGKTQGTKTTLFVSGRGTLLEIRGAALLESRCNGGGQWGGIYLSNEAAIRTTNGLALQGGLLLPVNARISHAYAGVYSAQPNGSNQNRYYLSNTDFTGNAYGFWDVNRLAAMQAGDGIAGCTFSQNETGVLLADDPFKVNHSDYTAAVYRNNRFTGNNIGLMAYADNLTLEGNEFTANRDYGLQAITSTAGTVQVLGNTVAVPASGTGIVAQLNNQLRGNILSGAGTGIRVAAGQVSITDNAISGFATGVLLDGADTYATTAITGNTFTDNQTGVMLQTKVAGAYGQGVPEIRCNSFSAPTRTNSKGIYLGSNVIMVNLDHPAAPTTDNVMGGSRATLNSPFPFGNLFTGITEPVRNDGTVGLVYYVYKQQSDDILASATAIGVDFVDAAISGLQSECNLLGYTTGVLTKVAKSPINGSGHSGPEAGLGLVFPNPAQEQATVPYVLPSGTKEAKLVLREVLTGQIAQNYALPARPQGTVQLEVSRLRNGLYGYSLEADGKQVATRILEVKH